MAILKTSINSRSEEFLANKAAMLSLVLDMKEKVQKISLGGHEKSRAKHLARGKLLPRDRVKQLLDVVETAGPDNVRNKIVSRLWMSSTMGETMVILNQVLGNGVIPTLTKSDVKAITLQ